MVTNGAIFSTFKHSDPHSVRDRLTLKDGKVNEHIYSLGHRKCGVQGFMLRVAPKTDINLAHKRLK